MAITFRAAGTVVTTTGTGLTLTAPTGVAATDIVLAVIYGDFGTGAITPPAGWTLVNRTDSAGAQNMAVYRALGSVASYAFTIPTPTDGALGFTLAYVGVNNTTPEDVAAAGQVNASSTTATAPSVTTVTANAWGVCFFGNLAASTFTDAAPLVHRQSGNFTTGQNSDVSADGADFPQAVAGATGTKTTTASIAAISIGITVALRPAGGASLTQNLSQPVTVGFSRRNLTTKPQSQPVTVGFARTSGVGINRAHGLVFGFTVSTFRSRLVAAAQPLAFGSARTLLVTKAGVQPLTFGTVRTFSTAKNVATSISFGFSLTTLRSRAVVAVQPLTVGFTITKQPAKNAAQGLTVGFPGTRSPTKATVQGLTIGFVRSTVGTKFANLSQPVTFGSTLIRLATKAGVQTITFGSLATRSPGKALSSPLAFGFALSSLRGRSFSGTQPLSFGFASTKTAAKLQTQPVTFGFASTKVDTKVSSQAITFSFTVSAVKPGGLSLVQTLTVGYALRKTVTKPVGQSIVLSSVSVRIPTKASLTSLSFNFSTPKSIGKAPTQPVAFAFTPAKLVTKRPLQGLTVSFKISAAKPINIVALSQALAVSSKVSGKITVKGASQSLPFGFAVSKASVRTFSQGLTVSFVVSPGFQLKTLLSFPLTTGFSFSTAKSRSLSGFIVVLENTLRDIQTLELCLQAYQSGRWTPGGVQTTAADLAMLETTISSLKAKIRNEIGSLV